MRVDIILLFEIFGDKDVKKIAELTGASNQVVYYHRRKYRKAKPKVKEMLKGIK